MTHDEMARRFRTMLDTLDLNWDEAMAVVEPMIEAEKEAKQRGIAYKAAGLSPIEQVARQTMPELYSTKGSKR